jgi:cytochrome P450
VACELKSGLGEAADTEGGNYVMDFADIPGPGLADVEAYNGRNHQYLLEQHEKYGDRVAMNVSSMARADSGAPTKRVVFVRQPAMCRKVLTSDNFAKTWDAGDNGSDTVDYVHNLVQPMLGNTVFNKQGEGGAHEGRLQLKPMFNATKQLSPGFAQQIDLALDSWEEGTMDALGACHDLIRQALLSAIAGSAATEADAQTRDSFHDVLDHFISRYQSSGHTAHVSVEDEEMMEIAKEAGMRVVRAWRHEGVPQGDDKTMLALMSRAGNSDEEMAAMLVNTIIAGAEAPGSTLAQLLQELAFNAPLQQALAAEVQAVAGGHGDGDVLAVNKQLKQVEASVMEGLRFFAPATLVQRQAIVDTTLGSFQIPAGTVVGMCVSAIHRDAKNFANPWTFDPRGRGKLNPFMVKDTNPFMTFSGGQRGCPGRHLGIMMLRLALGKIVQRFELTAQWRRPDDHLTGAAAGSGGGGIPKFVEWQVGGIPVQLIRRRPQPAGVGAKL